MVSEAYILGIHFLFREFEKMFSLLDAKKEKNITVKFNTDS